MFNPATIDLVTLSPANDVVLLYVVATQAWDGSDQQLNALQEKVHNYVGFALDGQLTTTYPETAGLPWRIVIESQAGAPEARSADLIDRLAEAVRRYGGDLTTAELRV